MGARNVLEAGGGYARTHASEPSDGRLVRPLVGYRLEKVVYESQPGFHVAANLYIPTTGKPPYPGVLFQMGHSTNGKAFCELSTVLPGPRSPRLRGAGVRPDGPRRRTYYPGPSPSRAASGPMKSIATQAAR